MARQTERRGDALSKERIVEAAIALLDGDGEGALTFRALGNRLATGSGALYWHVANKDDLLAAAADHVIAHAVTAAGDGAAPQDAIRGVALGVFDAIDAHPWVGAQLAREPRQAAAMRIFEGIGGCLRALGVPERARFDAWSALVNYILGVAGQNAAHARLHGPGTERSTLLAVVAAEWARLDPAAYPFLREVAAQLAGHDDRAQFLAGLDLILAGIATIR